MHGTDDGRGTKDRGNPSHQLPVEVHRRVFPHVAKYAEGLVTRARELERLLTEKAALVTTDLVIAVLHGLALGRLGSETALELVEPAWHRPG